MKKIFFFLLFASVWFPANAQVDIELRNTGTVLEVWIKPRTLDPGDFINGITFAIKWPTACTGADVTNSPVSNLAPLAMSTASGIVTSGSSNYKVYNGGGGSYNYAALNGTFIKIMTAPTSGSLVNCPFSIDLITPGEVDGNFGVDGQLHGAFATAVMMTGVVTNLTPVVLAVELTSFKAEKKEDKTVLKWESITEVNLSDYTIERSGDGLNFKPIGVEEPKAKSQSEKVAYTFTDEKPELGINYYRLKMEDTDGKITYSKVLSADFGSDLKAKTSPNPFVTDLNLEIDIERNVRGEVTIELFDMAGKQIRTQKVIAEGRKLNLNIPTNDLSTGTYMIRLTHGSFTWQQKITKQ
jgi:hypothetical protein